MPWFAIGLEKRRETPIEQGKACAEGVFVLAVDGIETDTGKRKKYFCVYIAKKGAEMKEGTRNQLDKKLRRMLDQLDQAEAKQKQPISQQGTGNIIRRRKGESEKRFGSS